MSIAIPDRKTIVSFVTVILCLFLQGFANAQDNEQSLRVGVYESPPFVVKDGEGWTGMAVELWEKLADNLGYRYDYIPVDNFAALVEQTAAGDIDVAVSNITITEQRHRQIAFTHSWFDAGLRLMVGTSSSSGFTAVWEGLRDAGHLRAYGWLALVIVIGTIIFTLFDRHTDPNFPKRWPDGLAESFHSVMSIATSGKMPSRTNRWGWPGRVGQALWLVCGVAVLAYVTSTVTSVMTTLTLTGQINSVADLSGHVSGVLKGSTAVDYVRKNGIRFRRFDTLSEAAEALEERRIDAVIADAPVLEYYLQQNPDIHARMAGGIFKPERYAFGVQRDSDLRRPLTVDLTAVQEGPEFEALRQSYFGPRQ